MDIYEILTDTAPDDRTKEERDSDNRALFETARNAPMFGCRILRLRYPSRYYFEIEAELNNGERLAISRKFTPAMIANDIDWTRRRNYEIYGAVAALSEAINKRWDKETEADGHKSA